MGEWCEKQINTSPLLPPSVFWSCSSTFILAVKQSCRRPVQHRVQDTIGLRVLYVMYVVLQLREHLKTVCPSVSVDTTKQPLMC